MKYQNQMKRCEQIKAACQLAHLTSFNWGPVTVENVRKVLQAGGNVGVPAGISPARFVAMAVQVPEVVRSVLQD